MRHVDDGLWRVPGGGREPLEDPAEAARRELAEEVGLEVKLERLDRFHLDFTNHEKWGEWLTFHYLLSITRSEMEAVKIQEPEYHDQMMWVKIGQALGRAELNLFEPTLKGLDCLSTYILI